MYCNPKKYVSDYLYIGILGNYVFSPIKSELTAKFRCLRCLNDYINFPDMIVSFASEATASLVAQNGTKIFYDIMIFYHNLALSKGRN